MKTTKGERSALRSALMNSGVDAIPGRTWWPDLLDDIDELEAKCAWQAEMLERLKKSLRKQVTCPPDCTCLLNTVQYIVADLEKGPTK